MFEVNKVLLKLKSKVTLKNSWLFTNSPYYKRTLYDCMADGHNMRKTDVQNSITFQKIKY